MGSDYLSDMAFDEVHISSGECPEESPVDSHRPCTFEETDICGYTNDVSNDFDWIRNGGSNSIANGPSTDHTYGTSSGQISK